MDPVYINVPNNAQYFRNLLPISTVVLYVYVTLYVTYLGSTFEINVFGINSTYQFCITYSMYSVLKRQKTCNTNEAVLYLLSQRHTYSPLFQTFILMTDFLDPIAQALCLVCDKNLQRMKVGVQMQFE
jgi:hypothetical protein